MKEIRMIMGMPVTVEIADAQNTAKAEAAIKKVFDYFKEVDERFSTYKTTSEITAINEGRLRPEDASEDMKTVFTLSEKTKKITNGYFDIKTPEEKYDPSGLVKGWAIWNAAKILTKDGFKNFYVDAGGDIEAHGLNAEGGKWTVGIKNPWNEKENVKILEISGEGIATSGTYLRGEHIYDPKSGKPANDIASITVVGPNIYEADRFATAAFAMGREGIAFIEKQKGLEGYMIDKDKIATMTSGFGKFIKS